MKPRKVAFLIRATICTFLMIVVSTDPLPPASAFAAAHRHNKHVPWDNSFHPRRDLPSRTSSRGNGIFRIRRSDYGNGKAELAGGPRYVINASPTSQPIMFFDDSNSESHEIKNSMLLIKKKKKKPPTPSHVTVFTHGSVISQEEPLISESELAINVHTHHKPWKLTTLSPPMYHYDFNSESASENYHSTVTVSPQKTNLGMSGSVWRRTTKTPSIINNHHPGSYVKPKPTPSPPSTTTTHVTRNDYENSAVVWQQPTTNMPPSGVISNHSPGSKGRPPWKKPTYGSEHNSKRPYQGLKKPAHSGHVSSTTRPKQLTTAIPHHFPDPPVSSSYFMKKPVLPSLTSTTQRTYSDRYSFNNKGPTQRPSSTEIKLSPHRVLSTTAQPVKKPLFEEEEQEKAENFPQVNNHRPLGSTMLRRKPLLSPKLHNPSSQVAIVDKHKEMATDVIGERIKLPETVRSKWMTVLDAPVDRATTIRHNKLIVAQKRSDKVPQVTLSPSVSNQVTTSVVVTSVPIITLTTKNVKKPTTKSTTTTKKPNKETFPVAPVMDPWADVPIPSAPSWAVSSTRAPSIASPSGSSFFPSFPFMPFLGSLFSPLMSRPLTPSALNTGMQGIKAMQGFLRNSMMGAMFCFLPSALIAMTMSATQRAELRKIPEVNDFMLFCKKCLENLENLDRTEFKDEPDWVENL